MCSVEEFNQASLGSIKREAVSQLVITNTQRIKGRIHGTNLESQSYKIQQGSFFALVDHYSEKSRICNFNQFPSLISVYFYKRFVENHSISSITLHVA